MEQQPQLQTQPVQTSDDSFIATLIIGTCIVLIIGTIFALINFIGGVLFPLWLRVILDLVNIILTLTLMIRGLHWERENIDPKMKGPGWVTFWFSLIGGGILVIGSFFYEEFISTHSLLLLVTFAVWFYYDLRN